MSLSRDGFFRGERGGSAEAQVQFGRQSRAFTLTRCNIQAAAFESGGEGSSAPDQIRSLCMRSEAENVGTGWPNVEGWAGGCGSTTGCVGSCAAGFVPGGEHGRGSLPGRGGARWNQDCLMEDLRQSPILESLGDERLFPNIRFFGYGWSRYSTHDR